MLKRFFLSTEHLLNMKLNNGTVMVVIIAFCVVLTWLIVPNTYGSLNVNILEAQNNIETSQYIVIDWQKYKIILEEVK